jgi:acyl-CoA thioesterase YciA
VPARPATKAAPPDRAPLLRTVAMPADANTNGDIFGGWLMGLMDLAGGNAAMRRAQGRVATVAVDAMVFHRPVFVGDEVSIYALVVGTGRSSIRVRVEAWRRSLAEEEMEQVTEAEFTFVAIGADRRPRPLPAEQAQAS